MGLKLRLPLLFLIVSIFIFFFSSSVFFTPFNNIAKIFSLPREVIYKTTHAEGSLSDYEKLEKENNSLRKKYLEIEMLKKDNLALRGQFENVRINSQKLIPAKVVGFKGDINNPIVLVINQGSKSNIGKNNAVVIDNFLVGKIGKVSDYFSEVILPTNSSFTILGKTEEDSASGIVNGYDEFMLFEKIAITEKVKKNEYVLTHGEQDVNGNGVAPDLIIGKIIDVNKDEAKPFQNAKIKSTLKFNKLSTVFVIIK